jgi:hypothetical protein
VASKLDDSDPPRAQRRVSALGLDWEVEAEGVLSCSTTLHGFDARLVLDLIEPGKPTLSLIGPNGPLWTRALDPAVLSRS